MQRESSRANALAWVVAVLATAPAHSQGTGFPLPVAGCPMAHCDPRMSDQVRVAGPDSVAWTRVDTTVAGGSGLGCVSNLRQAACTYRGDPLRQSNLVVYDAEGRRVWEDRGLMGTTAWQSAPIIGDDGSVIAADQARVVRVQPATGTVLWNSAKPDPGVPMSPVLIGASRGMVFIATNGSASGSGSPAISVYDVTTGALLYSAALVDATTGRTYVTRNTPAVSGTRAYVLANAVGDTNDGRMFALDVCEAADCGPRGRWKVGWSFAFKGPSGASPLLIGRTLYFDGRPGNAQGAGSFMAVTDQGTTPRLKWQRFFPLLFGVSAAQDARGGMWVAPTNGTTGASILLRLNADTGATDQQIDVSAAFGLPAGYGSISVLTGASTRAGAMSLVFGVQTSQTGVQPAYVGMIDVASSATGRLVWRVPMGTIEQPNPASSQFPVVVNARGSRRVIVNGGRSSTFFFGEP